MLFRQRIPSYRIWIAAIASILVISAGIARADILELRTGEIVRGEFLGGSPQSIRFRVNGQEQTFPRKDVLNIGFTDSAEPPSDQSNDVSPATDAASPNDPAADNAPAPPPPTTQSSSDAPPPADAQAGPPPSSAGSTVAGPPPAVPPTSPNAAPNAQSILIPASTTVLVRMIDSVNSSTNKIGDTFRASLEAALVVGNTVIAPKGADAFGKLTEAKDSGKISGAPELTLELTGIRINGSVVALDSTDYSVAGKSRGEQSAKRIGGGAVVGAVLGGILGGPRGAAIGATLGAGGGTAVQVATHGDHVRVPSETVLEFRLEQDVSAPVGVPATPAG